MHFDVNYETEALDLRLPFIYSKSLGVQLSLKLYPKNGTQMPAAPRMFGKSAYLHISAQMRVQTCMCRYTYIEPYTHRIALSAWHCLVSRSLLGLKPKSIDITPFTQSEREASTKTHTNNLCICVLYVPGGVQMCQFGRQVGRHSIAHIYVRLRCVL